MTHSIQIRIGWFCVCLSALIFVAPRSVMAHDSKPTRQAVLQLDKSGGAVLWRIEVRGQHAHLWRQASGIDLGTKIRKAGHQRGLLSLWAKAVDGVEFRIDGQPIEFSSAQMNLEENTEDKLVLLGLTEFSLPTGQERVKINCRLTKKGPALDLKVQGLKAWQLWDKAHQTSPKDVGQRFSLTFRDDVDVYFQQVDS